MSRVHGRAPSDGACRIVVTTSIAAAAHVEAALATFSQATLCQPTMAGHRNETRITAFARARPETAQLTAALAVAAAAAGETPPLAEIEPEPARDWLALNRESFQPFRVGRFFVSDSVNAAVAPAGAVHLKIDAGLAFGSGRHASTAGCLLALSDPLLARFVLCPQAAQKGPENPPNLASSILDLGCGSGILAIAAAKLWHCPALAIDVDRDAVAFASRNARRNSVGSLVRAVAADATRHPTIRAMRPFRLVIANILARPLRQMASAVALVCRAGSVLVLAGFVRDDAAAVATVYSARGFRRLKMLTVDGWTTLVLVRY